jgi:hypothetical protein
MRARLDQLAGRITDLRNRQDKRGDEMGRRTAETLQAEVQGKLSGSTAA